MECIQCRPGPIKTTTFFGRGVGGGGEGRGEGGIAGEVELELVEGV